MKPEDKIALAVMLLIFATVLFILLHRYWHKHWRHKPQERQWEEFIEVEDIKVGRTIYDLFPEWRNKEIESTMDEIEAVCNLYLSAKDLLQTKSRESLKALDHAVTNFEKYTLS